MYNGYLIGKISKVDAEYSEVTLLTSKNSKLSVTLNGTNLQILRGNGDGTFSVQNFNEGSVNEKTLFNIETSGVSDVFPKGIKVGTFKLKDLNAFKKIKEIRFTPEYDIFQIQNVMVYKWSRNDAIDSQIQTQVNLEKEQDSEKSHDSVQ